MPPAKANASGSATHLARAPAAILAAVGLAALASHTQHLAHRTLATEVLPMGELKQTAFIPHATRMVAAPS